jgi:poly [ADP-ribose] polymerase
MLNKYSSDFYSAIPHDFGYMNMQAFVINTEEKVKQKLDMLSSLSQI